ncbi:hypothetical protein FKM82_008481 [Ascaphus truei]
MKHVVVQTALRCAIMFRHTHVHAGSNVDHATALAFPASFTVTRWGPDTKRRAVLPFLSLELCVFINLCSLH